MDVDKTIIESEFCCSQCNRKIPQIALSINPDDKKTICNLCDIELFSKTYCKNKEDDFELRLLEVTEGQIKLMINEIRKSVSGKVNEVEQINNYWEFKTDNQSSLNNIGKRTIEKFLNEFSLVEIQQAMDVAFNKVTVGDSGKFKYLCGILNGKLKDKKRSPEHTEIAKYWNYKRPQNWKKADEGKVEHLISKYNTTQIKFYIDKLVDDERGWADFDSLIDALDENRYGKKI
jgi:hypothetical protein